MGIPRPKLRWPVVLSITYPPSLNNPFFLCPIMYPPSRTYIHTYIHTYMCTHAAAVAVLSLTQSYLHTCILWATRSYVDAEFTVEAICEWCSWEDSSLWRCVSDTCSQRTAPLGYLSLGLFGGFWPCLCTRLDRDKPVGVLDYLPRGMYPSC